MFWKDLDYHLVVVGMLNTLREIENRTEEAVYAHIESFALTREQEKEFKEWCKSPEIVQMFKRSKFE